MKTSELLKKTANVLRDQQEEINSTKSKLESIEKEAQINRIILNMIKEDLLDASDIEQKIAEFQGNPDQLKNASGFFEKSSEIGKPKGLDSSEEGNAEQNFVIALT